jgi:DNA-binding LytR/AlgR family response regulator
MNTSIGRALLGGAGLVVGLALYCELCSLVSGFEAPGLNVSVPWAVQVSLGWILVGVALGALAPRVASSRIASAHPRAFVVGSIVAIAAFTMSCEALLAELTGSERSLMAFIDARGPASVAISAVLIALFMADRLWKAQRHAVKGAPSLEHSTESEERCPQRQHVLAERGCGPLGAGQVHGNGQVASTPMAPDDPATQIEVMTGTGRTKVCIEHVECLQAERNYINVVHSSGREYLLRQTMSATERSLDPTRFIRVHRSTIVNRDFIKERRRDGVLVLSSGRIVRVSRAYRDRLH